MSNTISLAIVVPVSSCVYFSASSRSLRLLDDLRQACCLFASNAVAAARLAVRVDKVLEALSSVLHLGLRRVDVGSDYDKAVRVLREQRKSTTCLAALR